MMQYDTGVLNEKVTHYDDFSELKEDILIQLQNQREMWQDKIEEIIRNSGRSYKEFAELCRVSDVTVRKWRKGSLPQNRDMYIRIGFAGGFDQSQMNGFLQRYGQCPQLYAKSLEDDVCMYVLRSESLPHDYETYEKLLGYMKEAMADSDSVFQVTYNTQEMLESLQQVSSTEELIGFVRTHAASYKEPYMRLCNYIITYLKENRRIRNSPCLMPLYELAQEQNWSSSLRHCVSEIQSKRWYPQRNKIISLGLHLNMDLDMINEMLKLAQMEPLCAKYPAENILIFALEDAQINGRIYRDGSNELYEEVKNYLLQADIPDAEFLVKNL